MKIKNSRKQVYLQSIKKIQRNMKKRRVNIDKRGLGNLPEYKNIDRLLNKKYTSKMSEKTLFLIDKKLKVMNKLSYMNVRGAVKTKKQRIAKMQEAGFEITEDNYVDFINYIEKIRYKLPIFYDVEMLNEMYNAEERNIDSEGIWEDYKAELSQEDFTELLKGIKGSKKKRTTAKMLRYRQRMGKRK